ncbi:PREDICTED: rho GDP-dissociation inhibitor 3 [Ficedula albicollis]|uniref:rho GDP-dissociation inhibitor 3 n=1 Tax=Ficedula albicollis TaxID=59894 RepID=UPI0007AD7A49|nr:PREDICTED: rho GDP-dissociation inhibitor 3 [Ficedula albicollis]
MSEHRPGPGGTGASHGGDPRCPPATSQPVAPAGGSTSGLSCATRPRGHRARQPPSRSSEQGSSSASPRGFPVSQPGHPLPTSAFVSRGCPPGCPQGCHCLSPADIMADKEGVTLSLEEEEEDADVALAYKTPEKKSLQEIQELDPGDESLRKYKQALLGAIPAAVDASVPNVQVTKLTLMCEQAPGPITMDLTGDLEELRGRAFVLKEGVDYRVKVSFKVNREIVCGLRCLHLTYRRGRPVDRDVFMVGSYAPRAEEYEVVTPAEEAPRGWLARGSYRVRSLVTDDDKSEHLSWEWGLCIKKAWED